jgi:hypothetical protein
MKCHQILMAAVLLISLSALTTRAHCQGAADFTAAGLSPQAASLSPEFSVSPAPDTLGQAMPGGGGAKRLTARSSLSSMGSSRTTMNAAREGMSSQLLAAKMTASSTSSSSVPTNGASPSGQRSFLVSSSPSIHPLSAPRPTLGLSSGGILGSTISRAPRRATSSGSSSEKPLYSFMMKHERGASSPASRRTSAKGRPTGRARSAMIDSLRGGHKSR